MPKQPINIRLDADLIAAADARAAQTGSNRTELIDRGLRDLLGYRTGDPIRGRVPITTKADPVKAPAVRRDIARSTYTPPIPKGGKR